MMIKHIIILHKIYSELTNYECKLPVAIYDDNYKNGVLVSEFNYNTIYDKDREIYSKQ